MKNLKLYTITAICLLLSLIFTTSTKAQDDSNFGIIVDGTVVDSIPNWNFKKMSVVFPVTSEWKKYDMIKILIKDGPNFGEYLITPQKYDKYFSNVSIGALTILESKPLKSDPTWFKCYVSPLDDRCLKYKYGSEGALTFWVYGLTITGTKEVYQNGVAVKQPIYNNGISLYKSKSVPYWCVKAFCGQENKKQAKEIKEMQAMPWRAIGKPFTLKIEAIEDTPLSLIK